MEIKMEEKPIKPMCFGDFTLSDKKCYSCSHNIDCFILAYSLEECFNLARNNDFSCSSLTVCSSEQSKICTIARALLKKRSEKEYKCFGNIVQTSSECLLCKESENCEIYQALISDLSLDFNEINISFETQLRDITSGTNSCFGQFAFDKECETECDFLVRCRKKSNIIPAINCKFWPEVEMQDKTGIYKYNPKDKVIETKIPKSFSCVKNDVCLSKNNCTIIYTEILKNLLSRNKKSKIFSAFFALDSIRDLVEVDDEEENS